MLDVPHTTTYNNIYHNIFDIGIFFFKSMKKCFIEFSNHQVFKTN
jgi:hypothetical protein